MDKTYNPQAHEEKIYQWWQKSGAFKAPTKTQAEKAKQIPFGIIMPPPNANDPLHVGHAMFVTLEDILIRYQRMKGKAALWLPGTDHAGIETQYVFEKKLAKKGQSRFNFNRQDLFQAIWDYVQENSDVAVKQMQRLGASADWSRFKFTLDKDVVSLVTDTFIKLFQEKLVYRDKRLINYCPKCGTGYSELEVVYEDRNSPLYYLKYGPFTLATTRPETKFGDTAIAVHPQDKRYQKWVGQEIEVEGLVGNFKLKVIADQAVDPDFGTGVVKVTPAHDPTDFAIGQRHQLESKQIIDYNGKLNHLTGPYAGLSINQAREKIVKDLRAKGLLVKIDENYQNRLGTCYRCHRPIEPLPLTQFFIKTTALTKKALAALDKQETIILGAGREKILRHWLKNLKDWNISRQIVWGVRLPVWYQINPKNYNLRIGFLNSKQEFIQAELGQLLKRYSLKEIKTGLQTLQAPATAEFQVAKTSPGHNYLQETDTFDTWFSSGQWPIVSLKTNQPGDFEFYYPTQVMETAYDILPIWVMRMMLLGIYLTGKSPFKQVYLHGLIRDPKGQKMSKSKGNVINPIDLVNKYGADALRMALVMSSTPGKDSAVGEDKVKGMRNLTNKIWNAARFVSLMSGDKKVPADVSLNGVPTRLKPTGKNKKFIKKLTHVSQEIDQLLNDLKIGLAAEKVYNYFWHWYCDEVIEQAKAGQLDYQGLFHGLIVFLKLLHPFVPFVTEAVWQEIKDLRQAPKQLLIQSSWPK